MLRSLMRDFGQGLLVLAPIGITAYVLYLVVSTLDGWIDVGVPGLGLLLAILLITAIGHLTRNVFGRRILKAMEKGIERLPVVALVYGSLRDLFNSFVGDRRTFDKPVVVDLGGEGGAKVLGFVTCEVFEDPQLRGHVSVYLPQSYNFAGNLIVVPRERVHRLDAEGAQCMAFIVSGGVSQMDAARTVLDGYELGKGRPSRTRL